MMSALLKGYFHHGQITQLAQHCGVARQTVVQWLSRGYFPAYAAFMAELKLGIPAHKLMAPLEGELLLEVYAARQKKERTIQ